MKIKFIVVCLMISVSSCDDGGCGDDINLGKLELAETTRQFVPYSGEEILTFEDDKGNEHVLTTKDGRRSFESRLVISTLCRGNVDKLNFDDQEEFYQSQDEQLIYYDQSGNQAFYIDLRTYVEEANQLDSIAIYDMLSVYPSINGRPFRGLNIITAERQNEVSSSWEEVVLNNSTFIGDTTLFGKEFKEVYKSSTLEGTASYYNRINGVVAFKLNENEYWVLADQK